MLHVAQWLDLHTVAHVTATSSAASTGELLRDGWIADRPGEQTIEVRFRKPTAVRRLRLVFSEPNDSRTQEFTVWASLHRGERHREVVRQQFNFSPGGATEEIEEYAMDLREVSALAVRIVPNIDGTPAIAKLKELRVSSE